LDPLVITAVDGDHLVETHIEHELAPLVAADIGYKRVRQMGPFKELFYGLCLFRRRTGVGVAEGNHAHRVIGEAVADLDGVHALGDAVEYLFHAVGAAYDLFAADAV